MLSDKELIKFLHNTGHFWCPDHPDGLNVGLADLDVLTLQDKVVKDAISSWQKSDGNFSTVSGIVHGRDVIPDGDKGPVTDFIATLRRCGIPDNSPPPHAQFKYDDPYLHGAVVSMQQYSLAASGTGSGSFPVPGCDQQRKNRATEHSIVINLDLSRTPADTLSKIDEIILFCRKCSAEKGLAVRYTKSGAKEPTHYQTWATLRGSTIGINYFPQPGTCNQVVTGQIDIGFQASAIVMANLMVHEAIGHGIGLGHYRGGIMNASINLIDPLTWIGDPAESKVNQYFGGQAVPLDDSVSPPPPSPESGPEFSGELTGDHNAAGAIAIRGVIEVIIKAGLKPGKYPQILVPSNSPGKFHFEPKS